MREINSWERNPLQRPWELRDLDLRMKLKVGLGDRGNPTGNLQDALRWDKRDEEQAVVDRKKGLRLFETAPVWIERAIEARVAG